MEKEGALLRLQEKNKLRIAAVF